MHDTPADAAGMSGTSEGHLMFQDVRERYEHNLLFPLTEVGFTAALLLSLQVADSSKHNKPSEKARFLSSLLSWIEPGLSHLNPCGFL